MNIALKQAFTSTIFLKAVSLIIGFLFWLILSDSFTSYTWVTVPVAFYNTEQLEVKAPENVRVELKGRRSHLKNLDTKALAIHLNAKRLKEGPNSIEVTPDLLFLPSTIGVGEIIPHNITVTVKGAA